MSTEEESFLNWLRKDDWKHLLVGFILTYFWAIILEFTGLWFLMIIAGVLGGIFAKIGWKSFLAGFFGVLLAWLTFFGIYILNGTFFALLDLLSAIIALMLELSITIPGIIFPIMALLIGGLLGGVSALVGGFLTSIVLQIAEPEKKE